MNVKFCRSCRSLILADFRFCPYCGEAARGPDLEEALGGPFERMEARPSRDSRPGEARFAEVAELIERLESDMDTILSGLASDRKRP